MDKNRLAQPVTGIAYRMAASILLVGYAALVKLVTDDYPLGEVFFARSVFSLVPVVAWAVAAGRLSEMVATKRYAAHLGRTAVTTFAVFFSLAALAHLPIADATALYQSSPLVLVVLAAVLLGERVGIYRWSAVVVGFFGVFLIVSNYIGYRQDTTQSTEAIGVIFALLAALGYAFADIAVRSLARLEHALTITFYFSIFSAFGALATLPFGWVVPDRGDLVILVLLGVSSGVSQLFLAQSLFHADASLVASFDYLAIVWALVIGYVLFSHVPGPSVLLGAAIIGSAGLIVIWRERPFKRRVGQGL